METSAPFFRNFTRIAAAFPALLLCTALSSAQSLEDRVLEARRLQSQGLMQTDEQTLDSILRERRSQRQQDARDARGAGLGRVQTRGLTADSLISGPKRPRLRDSLAIRDTSALALGADSLECLGGECFQDIPKRYEQRIFRGVDRSAFSSARGAAGRDHVLGPGDAVIVSLWGDKEKEYDLILNPEGKVFLEGVGMVLLAGMNLDQAQAALKTRLSRIYSGIARGTAHVDVSLGRIGPVKVFVLGEVKIPGGYVLSGNSGVLSALYFAEGPTDIGTVRRLKLSRGGKSDTLDLYQYLIYGNALSPGLLREGDVLFAGRAEALVEIDGDVGRPAVYELKKGEGVRELLRFAGGLNPTAAAHKISLQRIADGGELEYVDLEAARDYVEGRAVMELKDGDRVLVERSTEQSKKFINVTGPVKYPGTYSSIGVRTLADIVKKAGGLREEAFLGRAHVLRFRPDGSSQLFAYSLDTARTDEIQVQARDNVLLYSLREMYIPDSVQVVGAVFNPGTFEFREGMTAKDLVMQAGGFLPQHETGKLIVFRGGQRDRKVEQIELNVESGLGKSTDQFHLKPQDIVQVPIDPRWYRKEVVTLDGLFKRPGKYALLYPGEKLASVIARAGGFKEDAYVEGGRFYRSRDSIGRVGVDLRRALESPRSKANIQMVAGDSIYIPVQVNTVRVMGEVGFETSILFSEGAPVQYYIEKAGGFTRRSEKERIVVQYANGETSRDGYFNRKPDAGSVIYVPQGPEPKPVDWFAGLNALLGTMGVAAAVILSIQAIQNN